MYKQVFEKEPLENFHYSSSEPKEFFYNTGPITVSAAIMFKYSTYMF